MNWHLFLFEYANTIEAARAGGTLIQFIMGILLVGLGIYWVSFTLWAIINAYHQRRLHFGRIILFALLNVVCYLIFRFVRQ